MKRVLIGVLLSLGALNAHAQAMSDYWENKVIDYFIRGQAYTPPASISFGLSTTACSETSPGTEVSTSGTGYARASVTSNMANWAGTQGAGTTEASTGSSGQTSNNVAITFPAPTDSWGQVGWFFAADGNDNLLFCATLTNPKTVNGGDSAPSFAIGAMTFTVQ